MARTQAEAVVDFIAAAERDDCPSHGLYRLLGMLRTIAGGKVGLAAELHRLDRPGRAPSPSTPTAASSSLAFAVGRPLLEAQARAMGLAALVVRNCFHFSALRAEGRSPWRRPASPRWR